jgi:hypothetical protein
MRWRSSEEAKPTPLLAKLALSRLAPTIPVIRGRPAGRRRVIGL